MGIHVGKSWLFHGEEVWEVGVDVGKASPMGEDGIGFGINPLLESLVVADWEPSMPILPHSHILLYSWKCSRTGLVLH